MNAPVVVVHQAPRRDCILVEGKRYCREESTSLREGALGVLVLVLFVIWAMWPIFTQHTRAWNPRKLWTYYLVPPGLILGLMIIFGG